MLYLYFGSDTYTLLEELKKLKAKFAGIVEELEITEEFTDKSLRSRLQELLESQGLFASKKLVILRNFVDEIHKFPGVENYLTLTLSDIGEGKRGEVTIVFLQTQDFDPRRSFFKTLRKTVHLKEFSHPAGQALETWIKKYLDKRGFKIQKQALEKLIELLGEDYDLWQAVNELEKLTLFSSPITLKAVLEIVRPNLSQNVFTLTNLFAEGKSAEAVKFLEQLVGRGPTAELKKQAIQIVGALASQVRSLLLVKDLQGLEPGEIAKILAWKQGRVWINFKLAKKFSIEKLKQLLFDLKQIDYRLKTSEEPPKLLLTLFLQKAKVN